MQAVYSACNHYTNNCEAQILVMCGNLYSKSFD